MKYDPSLIPQMEIHKINVQKEPFPYHHIPHPTTLQRLLWSRDNRVNWNHKEGVLTVSMRDNRRKYRQVLTVSMKMAPAIYNDIDKQIRRINHVRWKVKCEVFRRSSQTP